MAIEIQEDVAALQNCHAYLKKSILHHSEARVRFDLNTSVIIQYLILMPWCVGIWSLKDYVSDYLSLWEEVDYVSKA